MTCRKEAERKRKEEIRKRQEEIRKKKEACDSRGTIGAAYIEHSWECFHDQEEMKRQKELQEQ